MGIVETALFLNSEALGMLLYSLAAKNGVEPLRTGAPDSIATMKLVHANLVETCVEDEKLKDIGEAINEFEDVVTKYARGEVTETTAIFTIFCIGEKLRKYKFPRAVTTTEVSLVSSATSIAKEMRSELKGYTGTRYVSGMGLVTFKSSMPGLFEGSVSMTISFGDYTISAAQATDDEIPIVRIRKDWAGVSELMFSVNNETARVNSEICTNKELYALLGIVTALLCGMDNY